MAEVSDNLLWYGALLVVGVGAGFVNTLAGGGSLLTLPVLMLAGLPAHLANGTNRVAVLLQSLTGAAFFDREGRLDRTGIVPLMGPTFLGALGGAATAAYLPGDVLKPVLLVAMILIALTLLFWPDVLAPESGGRALGLGETRSGWWVLGAIGFYGGFAQAGVGILLLAALGGILRYDLVRANALKLLLVAGLTSLALAVFLFAGQVRWLPGLVLALGMVAGARLAVGFAMGSGREGLRRFVLVTAIVSCVAAWFQ